MIWGYPYFGAHPFTAVQEKVFAEMPRFGPHANIYAAGRCFHMCLDPGGEKPAQPFRYPTVLYSTLPALFLIPSGNLT